MRALYRDSRVVRATGWGAYGLLLLVTAVFRSANIPESTRMILSDSVLYLLPIALTLGGALALSVLSARIERQLWLLISGISVLILCSEAYFTWYTATVDPHGPSMPARFQLLQLAAVALGAWVVARMTTFGMAPARSVLRFALDVLGGLVVLAAGCYWFWMLPMFLAAGGETWEAAAISAVYPVVGATIVGFMGVVTAGGRTYRWRSWERLITGSFLLYGAGLILTPIAYLQMRTQSDPQSSLWATAALGFGYYVLFMSTVYRATSRRDGSGIEPWFFPQLGPKWFPTAYPIILAVALPILGLYAFRVGGDTTGEPIALAAVALAAILVARSWLRGSEAVLDRVAAYTDPVTGAFNYRYLKQRLAGDLAYARAAGEQVAAVTLGIEGLRAIANVAGPAEQNSVLAAVAAALREDARGDTTICRTGTDEFVVIARDLDVTQARDLARRLLVAAGAAVEPLAAHLGFSAGVSMFPAQAEDVDSLLQRSGAAQSASAAAEDSDVCVYDRNLEVDAGSADRLAVARTRSRRATARVLAVVVDARDPDTRRHSENVADLASALALMLDLPADRGQVLDLAAQMHDVGKIGVADSALRASGELTDEQREQIEQHPVLGERILAAARLDEILPAVRHHHERWDGDGYPDGLHGTEIPLEARILGVCDAYESMTSPRSYGANLTPEQAVEEIGRCSGKQFDPDIAGPFCRMISQIHGSSARDRAGRSGGEPPATTRLEGA